MDIHHVALRVADVERARAFYTGVLGLSERQRQHDASGALRAVWLQAGGSMLMLELALRGSGTSSGSAHLLAFAVADLAAWEARLERAQVPIDDRTAHTLYIRDADGHRVGLSNHVFQPEPHAAG
jgi:catechol 2,3-dioxygenase-like lactoylglutathione lyase family enzyme